jgi:hypothetical protein
LHRIAIGPAGSIYYYSSSGRISAAIPDTCAVTLAVACKEADVNLATSRSHPILEQEYATKGELHYAFRISYDRMARAIREGKLDVCFVDNKIQLKVEQVVRLFFIAM